MNQNNVQIIVSARDQATATLKGISGSIADIGKQAISFGLAQIGIASLSEAITGANDAFIKYNATLEQASISFKTLLGSAEAAQYFLTEMKRFADTTPFEFPQVQKAAQKLMAFGWAAKDIIPTLTSIGDAASGLSVGAEGIDRMVLALGQMKAKGKISGEEIMQLNELGINAAKILRDSFGQSVEEIQKSGRNVDEIVSVLIKGIGEKYKGLMAEQSKTFNGLLSTVKDQSATILGFLGSPVFDAAKGALESLSGVTETFSKIITEGNYDQFLNLFSPEWQVRLSNAYDKILSFAPVWDTLSEAVGSFLSVAGDVGALFGGTAFDVVSTVIEGWAGLAQMIIEGWQNIGDFFGDISVDIETYLSELWDDFKRFVDELPGIFEQCWQNIKDTASAYFESIFTGPLESIKAFADQAMGYLQPIKNFFGVDLGESVQFSPFMQATLNRDEFKKKKENNQLMSDFNLSMDELDAAMNSETNHFLGTVITKESALQKKIREARKKRQDGLEKGKDGYNAHTGEASITGSKGGSGADKLQNLSNKIQDTFEKLNRSIVEETGTTYELATSKVNDELSKMHREIVEKAQTLGIDTSSLETKMAEYARVMTDPIKRAQQEALKQLQGETDVITAKILGDKKAQADAEYLIALGGLDKERREKMKMVGQSQADAEAKLAVDRWYDEQKNALEQKHQEEKRSAKLEEFNLNLENNQLDFDLRLKSQEEINVINRQVLDNKISYLNEELQKEGLTVQQIIELRKQLAQAQQQKLDSPTTTGEAFSAGMQEQAKSWGSYFDNIKNVAKETAQAMRDAFAEFFFDAMTGKLKSLGDYIKSFLTSVAKAISNAMANAFAQKLVGSLFGGMFKGDGGPVYAGQPYVVGDRGAELFVPNGNGAIVPNSVLSRAGSMPSVVVNVNNNTGTKAEVRQETKFDGQRMMVNVFLDAWGKNIGGIRTAMTGGR